MAVGRKVGLWMSFLDIVTMLSGLAGIATFASTAIAGLINLFDKGGKAAQKAKNISFLVLGVVGVVLLTIFGSLLAARPTIAVNHQTGVSIPGLPTLPVDTTVVVVPTPKTAPLTQKTYLYNRKLACVSNCSSNLAVSLDSVNTAPSQSRVILNFTITNNNASPCSNMMSSITLQDVDGTSITPTGGTLVQTIPLDVSQTLQENLIFSITPQPNTIYTLHPKLGCSNYDVYKIETLNF